MAFRYTLELGDGTPAVPESFVTAVPNWRPGDTIPLGRTVLRVIEVRPARDPDENGVLIVEPD